MIPEEYYWIRPYAFIVFFSLGVGLSLVYSLIKKYLYERKQIPISFSNFIKKEYFPKKLAIYRINGSWEERFEDPFKGFAAIDLCVEVGEVLCYSSGSWADIYWQKYSEDDYVSSEEFHVSVGGDLKIYQEWMKENEHLKIKNKLNS